MFALAEVRSRTPRVESVIKEYARVYPCYPERNEDLCPVILENYSGEETPDVIGVELKTVYPKLCGLDPLVEITAASSINSLAEEYYRRERQRAISRIKDELKDWEIEKEEIFPSSDASSIH